MTKRENLLDAVRYWELRRLWYNLALAALAIAWLVLTWPHFRPAFTLPNLGRILILGALANLCYSAAYFVELPMQESSFRDGWRRWRFALWMIGTLFALVFAQYWIGDEIYPFPEGG